MLCIILELAYINLQNGVNQIIISSSVLRRSCETSPTKKLYFLYFRYSYTKHIKWCIDVLYCTDCNGYIMWSELKWKCYCFMQSDKTLIVHFLLNSVHFHTSLLKWSKIWTNYEEQNNILHYLYKIFNNYFGWDQYFPTF